MSDISVVVAPGEKISVVAKGAVPPQSPDTIVNVNSPDKVNVDAKGSFPVGFSGPGSVKVEVASGPTGPTGPTGPGVPVGGDIGEILVKKSAVAFDAEWKTLFFFGTGAPPDPSSVHEGALYFKIDE